MELIRTGKNQHRLAVILLAALLLLAACSDAGGDPPATAVADTTAAKAGTAVAAEVNEDSEAQPADSSEDSISGESSKEESSSGEVNAQAQPQDTEPKKSLTVCLDGSAPQLFLFGNEGLPAVALRHVVNENLITSAGYEYQAQGIEKLPSLADGDARRVEVTVNEGDLVVDVNSNVLSLRKGVTVTNSTGEEVDFAGEPITMEQLEVDFTLKPLVWSDGTPVSAVDSVFGFNVTADPNVSEGKAKTAYTQSYEALDNLSVRWTGLPGFMDQTYFTNVFDPLPAHLLNKFTVRELRTMDEVLRTPLSSGPYVIEQWPDEQTVVLAANPHYYRAGEGLPRIDHLTLHFGLMDEFLGEDSQCDIIAGGALGSQNLAGLEAGGDLKGWDVITSPGNVYEQIAYGILPVTDYRDSRPDWFGDTRVRQALAMCTDRERMVDELTGGKGEILETFAPSTHPLAPADLTAWLYDPAGGNALLDEAGYEDYAGDGRRQDVSSGVPMTVTLGTNSEDNLRLRVNEIFQENMSECGIPVELFDRPAGTWFGAGPEGPLFGRSFDLASFAWLGRVIPDCTIFTTDMISGPEEYDFGGWDAPNVSGWSNEAYDTACWTAVQALPGGEGFEENMTETLRIFNKELPALPLFTNYKVTAVRPGVENVQPDPTQPSELWNIAEWDLAE